MICPKCKEQGRKSTIRVGVSMSTAMYCTPFYDEEGKYHHHDSNTTETSYTCSNGHEWTERTSGSCWCGWKADHELGNLLEYQT